jgi:hypothetical protein
MGPPQPASGYHESGLLTTLLDGVNGRRLTISSASKADAEDIWSYHVALSLPEGKVETVVWDLGDGLARFLRELADGWAGFDGVKEFSSLEGQLSLSCRHDGRGTVECVVAVGQLEPPTWDLKADVDFGAGAHLERIAHDAEKFVARR